MSDFPLDLYRSLFFETNEAKKDVDDSLFSFTRISMKVIKPTHGSERGIQGSFSRVAFFGLTEAKREGNGPPWSRIDSFSWRGFTCGRVGRQSK